MQLDERTKIPLFAVLSALPFVVGGILWLSSIDAKASNSQDEVREMKKILIETHESVIRIEEYLKHKKEF